MTTEVVQFKLKLPKDLRDWVADQAAKSTRTSTSEIVHILKEKRSQIEKSG